MRPGRYNTDGILNRLEAKGFIHESDLVWLEKRAHRLGLEAQDAGEPAGEEHEKIHAAFKELFNKCTGEAHSNAFIDHCGMCMPRWGRVINRDKVLRKLSDEQVEMMKVLEERGPDMVRLRSAEVEVAEHLERFGFTKVMGRREESGAYTFQANLTDKGREHLARLDEKRSLREHAARDKREKDE